MSLHPLNDLINGRIETFSVNLLTGKREHIKIKRHTSQENESLKKKAPLLWYDHSYKREVR